MKPSPQICSAREFLAELERGYVRPGDQLLDDKGNRFVVVEEFDENSPRLLRLSDGNLCWPENHVTYPAAWLTGTDREGL